MLVQAVPVLSISLEVNQLVPQFKNKTELLETWSKKQNLQSVYRVVCDLEREIFMYVLLLLSLGCLIHR